MAYDQIRGFHVFLDVFVCFLLVCCSWVLCILLTVRNCLAYRARAALPTGFHTLTELQPQCHLLVRNIWELITKSYLCYTVTRSFEVKKVIPPTWLS